MLIITRRCMETNKRVQVLMSTYNGERYLREQLDSIVHQDQFDIIKVLIRDDGSTDGTRQILIEYCNKYNFEVIFGENVGVNQSIMILLDLCDKSCDYFAISDQDDVWLKNKISKAVYELDKTDPKEPKLFASTTCSTDENLNPLGVTTIPKKGISFYNAMIQNVLPGHTQVINRALLDELKNKNDKNMIVIDWWIYMVASAIGKVVVSDQYTVLHRQHGNNIIGCDMNIVSKTLYRLRRVLGDDSRILSQQLEGFLTQYRTILCKEYVDEIEKNLMMQSNVFTRFQYCLCAKVYRNNTLETLIYKILYLQGKYK